MYDKPGASLAIGFGPNSEPDAVLSLALFPRSSDVFPPGGGDARIGWVAPEGRVSGLGIWFRSMEAMDVPAIRTLIATALDDTHGPNDTADKDKMTIKSVSAKQHLRKANDLIVGFACLLPVGVYHGVRSRTTGEKLDPPAEGWSSCGRCNCTSAWSA